MTAATSSMIGASYAVTLAAYNSEMNRRLYDAASILTDDGPRPYHSCGRGDGGYGPFHRGAFVRGHKKKLRVL